MALRALTRVGQWGPPLVLFVTHQAHETTKSLPSLSLPIPFAHPAWISQPITAVDITEGQRLSCLTELMAGFLYSLVDVHVAVCTFVDKRSFRNVHHSTYVI